MKYTPLLLLLLVAAACNQVVDIPVPSYPPRLAINAYGTDFGGAPDYVQLFVGKSAGALDDSGDLQVSEATGQLYRDGVLIASFVKTPASSQSVIEAQVDLVADQGTYELRIQSPGLPDVSAVQTMPSRVPILSAEIDLDGGVDPFGEVADRLDVTFQDPAGSRDYYLLRVYQRYETPVGSGQYQYYEKYLEPFSPVAEPSGDGAIIVEDASFNGKQFTLSVLDYFESFEGNDFAVVLYHIDEDRYRFERSSYLYRNADGNPFAEPVTLHSNVEGGYGLFSLSAADSLTILP